MFVTVEGQCFVNIWRLKFDICVVPDQIQVPTAI